MARGRERGTSDWGDRLTELLKHYPVEKKHIASLLRIDVSTLYRWIANGPPPHGELAANWALAEVPRIWQELANRAVNKAEGPGDPSVQQRLDALVQALRLLADACMQAAALVEPTPSPSAGERIGAVIQEKFQKRLKRQAGGEQ